MKINVTPHLSIEDSDSEVISIINKIISHHTETLLHSIENENYDCFFVLIDLTKKTEPVEGTFYFIQHFGKAGDSGYMAYILKEVVKNRKELDIIIQFLERQTIKTDSDFMRGCSEMVKALRFGASLFELSKQGIFTIPPPHLN